MRNLNKIIKITCLLFVSLLYTNCEDRENFDEDLPSVLNIIQKASIGTTDGIVDDLQGIISFVMPAGTDLTSVELVFVVPEGVEISPSSGSIVDLTNPITASATIGSNSRTYEISARVSPSQIAFINEALTIEDIAEDDIKAAAQWAESAYGVNFVYIPFSDLTIEALELVNVVFFYYDQVGSSNLPQGVLDKRNVLTQFVVEGGKLMLGGVANGFLEEIGRDTSGLRTIIGTGAGGVNGDIWAVGFTNSPVSNALTEGITRNGNGDIDIINGGYKEDHNNMWNFGDIATPKFANFGSLYDAEVLAVWDHTLGSEGAGGIILWKPQGSFLGSMITIGIGGMEWNMNDNRDNPYLDNVKAIYKNSIDYLSTL